MSYKPFSDEQLRDLDARFGAIYVYTPAAKARPRWSANANDPPELAFQLVFRACLAGEWDNIMGQVNNEKLKARAPKNLAMATIVAVSVDGQHHIHAGDSSTAANDRAACKPPRDALERLMAKPGNAGIPEAVADALSELNGIVADAGEKG